MIIYNDNDQFAVRWLRELIKDDLIPSGVIKSRSITELRPAELSAYTQVHLFAGIGGWAYALRLAGVPHDFPIWTASCPCQPLSGAGLRKGHADERHLWPAVFRLIAQCCPPIIVGEQVASRDGREWFAGIRADLETLGYACGAADLCAASVGAPHIRQRLYWMANANNARECATTITIQQKHRTDVSGSSANNRVADASGARRKGERNERWARQIWADGRYIGPSMQDGVPEWNGATIRARCADGPRRIPAESALFPVADGIPNRVGTLRGAGNAIVPQLAAVFIKAALEA